ncbi:unnamed protein product [Ostreobium quekettii]|uniref:Sm domain-containing protein n=1 Tax=Ostreobium quekettii TaxID=121088 RepID=A0A8S1J6T0_9CHLO|nr:unnamed protein product [Ostreobium quekettii]
MILLSAFVPRVFNFQLTDPNWCPANTCTTFTAVTGVLKGYDQLMNLVLDETNEFVRDPDDNYRITDETRTLGLVVCRGPAVMLVAPTTGTDEIVGNPFLQQEEEV